MKLTPLSKILLAVLVGGTGYYAVTHSDRAADDAPSTPIPTDGDGSVPAEEDAAAAPSARAESAPRPRSGPGCADKTDVRFLVSTRSAQAGALFANGGPRAAAESLMCARGVDVAFARQEDQAMMHKALVAFATELSRGLPQPQNGAHIVAVDGASSPLFLKRLNDALAPLGLAYGAKIIGALGASHGEDKLMGPASWAESPENARGALVAGAVQSSAFQVGLRWLAASGLCSNLDADVYDPRCINWVETRDPHEATEKYLAGHCEERALVTAGKRTKQKKKVCVSAVATRTPGDVDIAQQRGGLVVVASTREEQVPVVIVGIDKWLQQNRKLVEGMLRAFLEGAEAVQTNPEAARRGAEISTSVYTTHDAAYWQRYFAGATESDKQGRPVALGGARALDGDESLSLLGDASGSASPFAAQYRVFGDLMLQHHAALLSSYPPAEQIVDISYLQTSAQP